VNKSVQIKGAADINRKLRNLPARVGKKVIRQSMRLALKPVRAQVQQEAPKASGKMAKVVKIRSGGRGRKGAIIMRITLTKDQFDKFYAAFRALGTKKMKGDPFMQRSVKMKREEAIRIARAQILAGVEREVRS
jgi:HK97 gp10 family phage protein